MLSKRTAALLCILTGVTMEVVIGAVSGRSELWDSTLYWTAGIPAALVVSVLVGSLTVGDGWLMAGLIIPAQIAAMVLRTSGSFTLWPLSIAASLILGAPLMIASLIASRLRARRSR